jgi:sugar lactone lactonase YvrE
MLADGPGNAWRWTMGKGVARYDPDGGKDTHVRDRAPMSAADPDGR